MQSTNLEYGSLCAFHGHSHAIDPTLSLILFSSILWLTKNHSMNARNFSRISALKKESTRTQIHRRMNERMNYRGETREKHSVKIKQILRMNQL